MIQAMNEDKKCSGENEKLQFMEFIKDQNSDDHMEATVLSHVLRISVWHHAEPPQQ